MTWTPAHPLPEEAVVAKGSELATAANSNKESCKTTSTLNGNTCRYSNGVSGSCSNSSLRSKQQLLWFFLCHLPPHFHHSYKLLHLQLNMSRHIYIYNNMAMYWFCSRFSTSATSSRLRCGRQSILLSPSSQPSRLSFIVLLICLSHGQGCRILLFARQ